MTNQEFDLLPLLSVIVTWRVELSTEDDHRHGALRTHSHKLAVRLPEYLAAGKAGMRKQVALQVLCLGEGGVVLEHDGIRSVVL
jgi:hypothetical protein